MIPGGRPAKQSGMGTDAEIGPGRDPARGSAVAPSSGEDKCRWSVLWAVRVGAAVSAGNSGVYESYPDVEDRRRDLLKNFSFGFETPGIRCFELPLPTRGRPAVQHCESGE